MADDDDAGEVEGEDVLFRELQTTSVYDSLQRAPPERHILTLSRAEARYQPIAEAALGMDAASIAQSAPEIVVQVRKRAGAVQLLIDGFVSEGTQDAASANVRTHYLDFHKGLHEDWETKTRVFSPLAIVAAVEDGQHPMQRVTVATVQHFFSRGERIGDPDLLAEVNLAPHRVSEVRCAVVRAPYPLKFSKPFTLTISDASKKDAAYNKGVIGALFDVATGAIGTAAYYKWLAPTLVGVTQGGTVVLLGASAGIGFAISALLKLYGQDWLAAINNKFMTMRPVNPLGTETEVNKRTMKVLWAGTKEYLKARPIPQEQDVTFTLEEFAKTLETLAVLKSLDGNDDVVQVDEIVQSHDFRREKVLWHWLCSEDAGALSSASGLKVDEGSTAGLHVRISIDDPMACAPETQHHEIHCGRADAYILGAAANGAIHDLARIRKAIVAYTAMLSDAIHSKNTAQTWPDKFIFAPCHYFGHVLAKRWRKNPTNMGALRKVKAYTTAEWNSKQGPNGPDSRIAWFKKAKELLSVKLLQPFFGADGPVVDLMGELTNALESPRAPLVSAQTAWVRRLPQRVRAQLGTGLFARAADFATEYVDVYTEKAIVREFTSRSGLVKMVTTTMKQSKTALQRFVKQWEAGPSTHVALVCMCAGARVPPGGGFREPPRWSALTLSTPTDVQFAAAIASVPERTRRRLRLVVRRAQQTCDKSVLEALGLAHTNADLLACQVFGDLWIAELLAMHAAPNAPQVQMLEQASRRAAARLRAAGDLLLRLVVAGIAPTDAGEGNDVAPTSADIALIATQAGRDAGRLLDRILFSQDFAAVRAAMVPLIRNCAFTAKRAAAAFEKRVPVLLPHAPTASLFGDRHDGVAAFLRATSLTSDAALVHAMTAAYPSTLLLDKAGAFDAEQVAALRARAPAKRLVKMPRGQVVAAMRFRLASLQMEPTADDAENLSIDELAEKLAAVELGGAKRSYYVPFGFGDARPAPTFPPCAAPLFGTVPVFCDALAYAFGSVLRGLKDQAAVNPPAKPLCVRLVPVLDCLRDPNAGPEVETAHPNTVHVSRTNVDGKACVTVIYAASRAPVPVDAKAAPPAAAAAAATALPVAEVTRAAEASGDAKDDARAVAMAARVSSTAWNAERVVQAVVAALASAAIGEEFDAVELTLELPPDGIERSYWYTESPDPFRMQQGQHARRMEASRLCRHLNMISEQHLGLLDWIFTRTWAAGTLWGQPGIDRELPPDKDWLEVARMRDQVLDVPDPTTSPPTIRQKLLAPGPLASRATVDEFADLEKRARAIFPLIAKAQEELKALLERGPIVGSSKDIDKARRVLKAAPPPSPKRLVASNEASRRALIGSLGLGMAMLVPLLQDVRVECAGVAERNRNDADVKPAVMRVVDAFGACEAVRLSEACLVVSEHVLT